MAKNKDGLEGGKLVDPKVHAQIMLKMRQEAAKAKPAPAKADKTNESA